MELSQRHADALDVPIRQGVRPVPRLVRRRRHGPDDRRRRRRVSRPREQPVLRDAVRGDVVRRHARQLPNTPPHRRRRAQDAGAARRRGVRRGLCRGGRDGRRSRLRRVASRFLRAARPLPRVARVDGRLCPGCAGRVVVLRCGAARVRGFRNLLGAGQAAPETTTRVSPRVVPAGRSLRRENSSRGAPRREAPEFSPSADPGSLLRASSLRRERSTRQLAPETPTRVSPRVSPRVLPLGAGQAAPETTTRVSPRVAPAGRSLRRENSSRGPPRRVAPEFAADPEPPGQAAATEAEAPETAAAPLRRATSLRRERSSRKL
mmetsp:Transcript_11372/g.31146  ORF Transcript_11372/g.31146 Transcript_11372/m.31146 type:complete len:320 (-) Transcript_11372:85-1044(-)